MILERLPTLLSLSFPSLATFGNVFNNKCFTPQDVTAERVRLVREFKE
jgi:hypothetical protein